MIETYLLYSYLIFRVVDFLAHLPRCVVPLMACLHAFWNRTTRLCNFATMSDTEEITRKLPGGSKLVETVEKVVDDDTAEVRVVKKRKIDEIPAA